MGHEMGLWVDLISDKTIHIIMKFYTPTLHQQLIGHEPTFKLHEILNGYVGNEQPSLLLIQFEGKQ